MTIAGLNAWNPHFSKRSLDRRTIEVLLSPLAHVDDIVADRELCQEILGRLQLARQPISWHLQPILTSYFGDPDATGSERWPLVWSMSIVVDDAIDKLPILQHEFFELTKGGIYAPHHVPPRNTPYWVICDFQDQSPAQAVSKAIRKHQPQAPVTLLNLNDQFIQLQVDLGVDPPEGFATGLEWAEAAEQICRDRGGIANNEERENEWDVVYNANGIALNTPDE